MDSRGVNRTFKKSYFTSRSIHLCLRNVTRGIFEKLVVTHKRCPPFSEMKSALVARKALVLLHRQSLSTGEVFA